MSNQKLGILSLSEDFYVLHFLKADLTSTTLLPLHFCFSKKSKFLYIVSIQRVFSSRVYFHLFKFDSNFQLLYWWSRYYRNWYFPYLSLKNFGLLLIISMRSAWTHILLDSFYGCIRFICGEIHRMIEKHSFNISLKSFFILLLSIIDDEHWWPSLGIFRLIFCGLGRMNSVADFSYQICFIIPIRCPWYTG